MSKTLKIIGFISAVILALSIGAIFITHAITRDVMLDESKLKKSGQIIEVYSSSGNLVAKKSSSNGGNYIKITKLSNNTKNAFIAIEDKRFYTHNGIDVKRILSATLENIKSLSFKEGASTITQQLIKNTHLSSEKTVKRKLKEIKLAINLERKYSKDEILEMYLNTIYFGRGAYGIEDASQTYFNKSASNLTLNESAMLAGIIKAPSTYSPESNYDLVISRKNLVLKVMKECGFISENEYKLNSNSKLKINAFDKNTDYGDYVNATISEYENSNNFMPYGNSVVKLYTYLDESLQKGIDEKTTNYDENKIVINSKLCGVTAFIGKYSNIKRNPASCVKPWLVYAPMINDGYIKESSVIDDEEINFNGYSPKNYNDKYHGAVTVKYALSNSLNVPTVKLLNGYGLEKVNNYTKLMNLDVKNENLTCALGGITGGLTLKELCDKYSVFNGGGNFSESKFIKSIYFDNIKIYEHTPKKSQVFSEETAFIINDILKNSVESGTSKKLRTLPFDICAKTGTNGNSNGNFDALSIAYTTDSIVGVWVGNYDNEIMPNSVTGSNEPSAISYKVLQKLYKNSLPLPFSKPNGVIEVNIDVNYLLENKIETISTSGERFYYIKGSEPNLEKFEDVAPSIISVKTALNNGNVSITYNVKNADNIVIYRVCYGKEFIVYKGEPNASFTDKLKSFGTYHYKIIAKNENKEETIYITPSVKYDKTNLSLINGDKWLFD